MARPAAAGKIGLIALATLLGCALCLLTAVPATAAPAWLGPTDLSAPLRDAANADVAMDDAGNLVAVWERSGAPTHPIQASVRDAAGSFSAPIELAPTGTAPEMAMTPSGTAIVVFTHLDAGLKKDLVQARIRPPGGAFGPALDVAALEPGFSVDPQVAVNAAGDAAVIWLDQRSGNKVVQASTKPAGGSFSNPVDLSEVTHSAPEADVSVDPSGNALVVWRDFSAENPNVIMFSSGKGASFSSPDPLSTTADIAFEPKIALDSSGDPTVVWLAVEEIEPEEEEEPPEFEPSVIESSRRVGASFTTPVELSDSGEDSKQPQLATGPGGEAIAVWVKFNGSDWIAEAAVRQPGGEGFGPATELSDQGEDAEHPELAVNSSGAATVVWQAGTTTVIQAAVRPAPGEGFGAPLEISDPSQAALFPQPAMDQAGDAVAVWVRSNGANEIAQAAGYDANTPRLDTLGIPTQGTVGIPVGFSVEPFDVWPITSTVFDFGDGSSAPGTSVSHVYSAPGTYSVTAMATDAAGNATSAGGTISILASNEFSLGKLKRNKRAGTATLVVVVPGPGRLSLFGKGAKRSSIAADRAGNFKLAVKPSRGALKSLRKDRNVKVNATIVFSPTGGNPATQHRVVILVKKPPTHRRHHRR